MAVQQNDVDAIGRLLVASMWATLKESRVRFDGLPLLFHALRYREPQYLSDPEKPAYAFNLLLQLVEAHLPHELLATAAVSGPHERLHCGTDGMRVTRARCLRMGARCCTPRSRMPMSTMPYTYSLTPSTPPSAARNGFVCRCVG